MRSVTALSLLPFFFLSACGNKPAAPPPKEQAVAHAESPRPIVNPLPGMPPVIDPADIYSEDHTGKMNPVAARALPRIYVPNTISNTVDVIDPATYKVIDHFKVGRQPQHVTPSYDLTNCGCSTTRATASPASIPLTGKKKETIPVDDPYNMYYTPDGKYAIVVAEQRERLEFSDAATMKLKKPLSVNCKGVDHMDFSADGRYLIASCEFAGAVIKVDVASRRCWAACRWNTAACRRTSSFRPMAASSTWPT